MGVWGGMISSSLPVFASRIWRDSSSVAQCWIFKPRGKARAAEKEGNTMRIKLFVLAMPFMVLPALGQTAGQTTLRGTPDETFKFVSHDEVTKRLMKPWPNEVYASAFMDDHEYFFVEFVKRLDHGNYIEQHSHWIDQTTVLSGEGILTYGGTIDDRKEIAPGEFRGHKQSGAKTIHVHPGDFVLISPGTPHHFDAVPGTVLNYVVYKHRV
jgi:quercetin dioxygenase-like cupin family protein